MKTVNFDKWIAPISLGIFGAGADYEHEHNDCSVRALANCTGMSYKNSHGIHKSSGRKNRKGTNWISLSSAYAKAQMELKSICGKSYLSALAHRTTGVSISAGTTVKTFLKNNPKGKYILIIKCHALTVIDGGIIDGALVNANSRIAVVWEAKS